MKKILPTSGLPAGRQGFTLVELLVTIAIIAILAAVGITIFSNTQQGARDSRRQSDIGAIAQALEVNKVANTSTYSGLTAGQFASGAIPVDTTTAQYSVAWSTTAGAAAPAKPAAWAAGTVNPATYSTINTANPPSAGTAVAWTICALLEKGSNPTNIYCLSNQQ